MKLGQLLYSILFSSHFLIAQESTNDLKKIKDYYALLKQVAALPIELQEHIGSYYYADLKNDKNYIPSINSIYQIKKLPTAQDITRDATISEKEKQKRITYWQNLRKGNFSYYKGPLHKVLDFLDKKLKTKPNQGDWATLCYKDIPLYTVWYGSQAEQELQRGYSDNHTIFGPNKNGLIIDGRYQHLYDVKNNRFATIKNFLFKIFGRSYSNLGQIPITYSCGSEALHPTKNKFIKGGNNCFQECSYDSNKKIITEGPKFEDHGLARRLQVMYDPMELEQDSLLVLDDRSLYQIKKLRTDGFGMVPSKDTKIFRFNYFDQARMQFSRKFPHLMIINGTRISEFEENVETRTPGSILFSRDKEDNLDQTYENFSEGGLGFCQKPDVGPLPENIVCFTELDQLSRNFPQTIENAQQESRKLLAKEIAKELSAPLELAFAKVL